jgi:hypothetical protein
VITISEQEILTALPRRVLRVMAMPLRVTGERSMDASPAWLDDDHLLFVSNRDGLREVYRITPRTRPSGPTVSIGRLTLRRRSGSAMWIRPGRYAHERQVPGCREYLAGIDDGSILDTRVRKLEWREVAAVKATGRCDQKTTD